MARSKLPPVRRESSSEFFNKRTATWEDANGKVPGGKAPAVVVPVTARGPAAAQAKPEAGVVQLVIAVAGIYASL